MITYLGYKDSQKKKRKKNSTCFPSFHERRIRYEKHKKLTLTWMPKKTMIYYPLEALFPFLSRIAFEFV